MDGRCETGDEQSALGAGEDFVKLAAHGALTGGVATALDVGRILQKRKDAFFSVLREGVRIEQAVVGGGGGPVGGARVNYETERGKDRQPNANQPTVRRVGGR